MESPEPSQIAEHCKLCLRNFDLLVSIFEASDGDSDVKLADVVDARSRFQIWLGNLGAQQSPSLRSSLDYRLREAPKIKHQIVELLGDLTEALEEVIAIASGERPNRTASPISDGAEEVPNEPLSEVQEIFQVVPETISSLLRLSIVIQRATPRDRFSKALASAREPFDDQFDVAHVGYKFPRLQAKDSEWLKQRLGNAITQRRQYLRYAREHREKKSKLEHEDHSLSASKDVPSFDGPIKAVPQGMSDAQSAFSGQKPSSTLAPTAASTLIVTKLDDAEQMSDTGISRTSFATSVEESSSPGTLRVPPLSDFGKAGVAFECPFCWTIQTFRSQRAWKKHVFEDVRPYVCTYQRCDVKLFGDRKTWFEHEIQHHRFQYRCPFCKHALHSTEATFNAHVKSKHQGLVGLETLETLAQASQVAQEHFPANACPLCNGWEDVLRMSNAHLSKDETIGVTASQFRNHLGHHMEQLALFAIPRGYKETDEADSGEVAAGSSVDLSQRSQLSSMPSVPDEDVSQTTLTQFEFLLTSDLYDQAYQLATELSQDTTKEQLDAMLRKTVSGTSHERDRITKCLLEKGANPNARHTAGRTCLHFAASFGNATVMRYLLDAGADVKATTEDGWTPLHDAARHGNGSHARLLLYRSWNSDINALSKDDCTPLHLAAMYGHKATVVALLERKASLEAQDLRGFTPLSAAVAGGHLATAERLLTHGATPNVVDVFGQPLLHMAIELVHPQVVHTLCFYGADTNMIDQNGLAPIIVAAATDRPRIIATLLEFGASFKAWRDAVPKVPSRSILLALDNLVNFFRSTGQHNEADEVQSAIRQETGGLHQDVERPHLSGNQSRDIELGESQSFREGTEALSQPQYGYDRSKSYDVGNNQDHWKSLERKQLSLIEERKREYGEDSEEYLGCLDMLGALYQDWVVLQEPGPMIARGISPKPAQHFRRPKENLEKMSNVALLLYAKGRKSRAVEIKKALLMDSGYWEQPQLESFRKDESYITNCNKTSFALRIIAEGFKRREQDQMARTAQVEAEEAQLREELDVLLKGEGKDKVPSSTYRFLENAANLLWERIRANQDSYIMSHDEFALFNHFGNRFMEGPREDIANRAVDRFWVSQPPRPNRENANRSSKQRPPSPTFRGSMADNIDTMDEQNPSRTANEQLTLKDRLKKIAQVQEISRDTDRQHYHNSKAMFELLEGPPDPQANKDELMLALWAVICELESSSRSMWTIKDSDYQLLKDYRQELSDEPCQEIAKRAVTRFWHSYGVKAYEDELFDSDYYARLEMDEQAGDVKDIEPENSTEQEQEGIDAGREQDRLLVLGSDEIGKESGASVSKSKASTSRTLRNNEEPLIISQNIEGGDERRETRPVMENRNNEDIRINRYAAEERHLGNTHRGRTDYLSTSNMPYQLDPIDSFTELGVRRERRESRDVPRYRARSRSRERATFDIKSLDVRHQRRLSRNFDQYRAENVRRFCYCDGTSYGDMVACDMEGCPRKLFHLECAGLEKLPAPGAKWYCDDCKLQIKQTQAAEEAPEGRPLKEELDFQWHKIPFVLIVASNPDRLAKLSQNLPGHISSYCYTLYDPNQLRRKVLELAADVVLLDIDLPGSDDIELVETLVDAAQVPTVALLPPSKFVNRRVYQEHGVKNIVWKGFLKEGSSVFYHELRRAVLRHLKHLSNLSPLEYDRLCKLDSPRIPERGGASRDKVVQDVPIPDEVSARSKQLENMHRPALWKHLQRQKDRIDSDISSDVGGIAMRLRMMGETPESAEPYVVVMCENEATRRSVEEFYGDPDVANHYRPVNPSLPQLKVHVQVIGDEYRSSGRRGQALRAARADRWKFDDIRSSESDRSRRRRSPSRSRERAEASSGSKREEKDFSRASLLRKQ